MGQPCPNLGDTKLMLKGQLLGKKAFDHLKFRLTKQLVEQCIGRIRRHTQDYGVALLCDWRYKTLVRKGTKYVPRWDF